MSFKSCKLITVGATVFNLLMASPCGAAQAVEGAKLTVRPGQCVSLVKGRQCYIDVDFIWQAPVNQSYCLHSSTKAEPLQCWQPATSGQTTLEIVADQDVVFTLQVKGGPAVVASAQLKMAWVYKKRNRPHTSWRVF